MQRILLSNYLPSAGLIVAFVAFVLACQVDTGSLHGFVVLKACSGNTGCNNTTDPCRCDRDDSNNWILKGACRTDNPPPLPDGTDYDCTDCRCFDAVPGANGCSAECGI